MTQLLRTAPTRILSATLVTVALAVVLPFLFHFHLLPVSGSTPLPMVWTLTAELLVFVALVLAARSHGLKNPLVVPLAYIVTRPLLFVALAPFMPTAPMPSVPSALLGSLWAALPGIVVLFVLGLLLTPYQRERSER